MNAEKENCSNEENLPQRSDQDPQPSPHVEIVEPNLPNREQEKPEEQKQVRPVDEEAKDKESFEKEDMLENEEEEDEGKDLEKGQSQEEGQEGNEQGGNQHDEGRKNIRKNSSESIRESRQNETSQLQTVVGGKKCFNKLCTSKKIFKKIRSRVENAKYRFLCKSCYDNYVNNYFCQFCQQIYSNQDHDEEDMNRWVGCDSCDRWNHIECQKRNRHKGFDINKDVKYECLSCSRKSRNGGNLEEVPKKKVEKEYDPSSTRNRISKLQINKEDRISIFHKKPQNFPSLEPFLQSFNFRLWINEALIRDDIDNLRSLLRRPATEEEPKKAKKIKQD